MLWAQGRERSGAMKLSFWNRLLLVTSGPLLLGTITVAAAWIARRFKYRPPEKKPRLPDSSS
jgi:hypothetical protein